MIDLSRSIPLSLAFALLTISAVPASAQRAKVEADKPKLDDLPSPNFSGGKQKTFTPKDWLEIEAKIRVSLSPEPKSKACERITIKWFVAAKNPDSRGFLLLTKDVEHVNVPLNEDVYVSAYLSPASVKRLTGSDKAGRNSIDRVGYEVLVNGVVAASESTKGDKWWTSGSANLSQSNTVPLLDKSQTPFAPMWWDRYAEIAKPAR